ncbi:IS256 family transposase [Alkalihalobacillus sp. 1P02AB]|uniref:IS256 family transposase n=1 Tax=Alkalihalobacillus sp. 1P02AB TaxID=3132260 RepID=UPI0039A51737
MTQVQFNLNLESLTGKINHSNLDEITKAAIVLVFNEIMKKEQDDYLRASSYERIESRVDYRNGYYERELILSSGKITLKVPRTRSGEFSPSLFERYSRVEQSLVLSMMEMVIQGVSTRKVTHIVEQLCGQNVSKSFVSSMTEKLDPVVRKWSIRPLNVVYYPYVSVDAMYIKVREHQKVVSKAVYIAQGFTNRNKKEIIGFMVSHQESYEAWKEFLQSLKQRGLASPKLMISDAHQGLKKAISTVFVGTPWQRCTVHFKRNLFSELPKKGMEIEKAIIKDIFNSLDAEMAREKLEKFLVTYKENRKLQKTLTKLEEGFEDAIQFLNEPIKWQRHIRSTNSLERLNQEIRRREKVIRIFPNDNSAFRLIGALLIELDERKSQKNILS